jgi:hypothetical protein
MSELINIKGVSKPKLLAALFNGSRQQGMGALDTSGEVNMSEDEAQEILGKMSPRCDFDYLRGRVMKIDLSGDDLDPLLYDRDNGKGAAFNAVKQYLVGDKP